MKNLILILLLTASILTIKGCKKDKASETTTEEKTNQEKIVGKWNLISYDFEITEPSKPVQKGNEKARSGDYFDFRADGKVYSVIEGAKEQSSAYTITNNQLKIGGGEVYTIKELTDSKLAFEEIQISATRTLKQTFNLSK
jgi:hypothetical protein